MKKQNLKEEKEETPKKLSWNAFREMNLDDIKKIITEHDRLIIFTSRGDIYQLTEVEF